MIQHIPQFVPQDVCLSCDGCCRFKEEESVWRPRVSQEEIKGLSFFLGNKQRGDLFVDKKHYLKALNHLGGCQCLFFDASKNSCQVYAQRPFQCALYPFLLGQHKDELVIYVHLSCPYVQKYRDTEKFTQYIADLKDFFRQDEILKLLKKNLSWAGDYSLAQDEVEVIFKIEG